MGNCSYSSLDCDILGAIFDNRVPAHFKEISGSQVAVSKNGRTWKHVSAHENQQRAEVHRPHGGGQQGGADTVLGGRDGAAVCRDRGDADAVDGTVKWE